MRKIELVDGIFSSVLGFGCAPILGSVDAKKAQRAVDLAIDNGINHFDLARSYGYGEAERFIGKLIQGKRNHLVLASKFGIEANWKARILQPLKPGFRAINNKLKRQKTELQSSKANSSILNATYFYNRMPITSDVMNKSLDKSLYELKTDYLDYLFVHEPIHSIAHFDDLAAEAENLIKRGKIRAWGLAYMNSQEILHKNYIKKFNILQFDNPKDLIQYDTLVAHRADKSNIIFSPFNGGRLDQNPSEKLIQLSSDFAKSVILCSMFNEVHLKENIGLFNLA